jgi:hypothetical protein
MDDIFQSLSLVAKWLNDIHLTIPIMKLLYPGIPREIHSSSSMSLNIFRQHIIISKNEGKMRCLQNDLLLCENPIEKTLEVYSIDEYDDFTPTHPQPKESKHRRGNSLFNSDIETLFILDTAMMYQGISLESIKLN